MYKIHTYGTYNSNRHIVSTIYILAVITLIVCVRRTTEGSLPSESSQRYEGGGL